jgi:hypothetical protein
MEEGYHGYPLPENGIHEIRVINGEEDCQNCGIN